MLEKCSPRGGKLNSRLQIIKEELIAATITILGTKIGHFKRMIGICEARGIVKEIARYILSRMGGKDTAAAIERDLKRAVGRACRSIYKECGSCCALCKIDASSRIVYLPSKLKVNDAFVMFVA